MSDAGGPMTEHRLVAWRALLLDYDGTLVQIAAIRDLRGRRLSIREFAMANAVGSMSVGTLLAFILLIVAGVVGTSMVVLGMIEEVPSIVRGTLQRTIQRLPRS